MIDQPISNPDAEAAESAFRTHYFDPEYDRCVDCDCRPWGRIAQWPCGTRVPREQVEHSVDYMTIGAVAHGIAKEAVS